MIGGLSIGELLGYVLLPGLMVATVVAAYVIARGLREVGNVIDSQLDLHATAINENAEAIDELREAVDALERARPTGNPLSAATKAGFKRWAEEHGHT